MAETTKIQWCDHTFNPWRGCTKISPGCTNCYAETLSHRNPKVLGEWGPNGLRAIASESYWRQPLAWNRAAQKAGERRRVFCASMADVFEDRRELIAPRRRLFALIGQTPHLDWLLLTKRPEKVQSLLWQTLDDVELGEEAAVAPHLLSQRTFAEAYPNVWLGVSIEDQQRADERLHVLRSLSASVRFVSYEPAIGAVGNGGYCPGCGAHASFAGNCFCATKGRLHWWIVGGESGRNARSFRLPWADRIVSGCVAQRVACFVKQMGSEPMSDDDRDAIHSKEGTRYALGVILLRDDKGGDPEEWPERLRVRQFPEVRS